MVCRSFRATGFSAHELKTEARGVVGQQRQDSSGNLGDWHWRQTVVSILGKDLHFIQRASEVTAVPQVGH